MKVRMGLLGLGAILSGFAVAQAATLPDGSMDPSIGCAPSARSPTPLESNYEQSSSMSEMCTAANPWNDEMNRADTFVADKFPGPTQSRQ
jgi:hypothetical protein